MTFGSYKRGRIAMGMLQDGCEALSALSLRLLVINQVELLKKVRFKGAPRSLIAENVLPLVKSQENHVLLYLANQL